MKIDIKPLEGIYWDDKKILLGDTSEEIITTLGMPEVVRGVYYYFDSDLSIHFNHEKRVEFIEFLGGVDSKLEPYIYGVKVFSTPAEDLLILLKRKNSGEINDEEAEYGYNFLDISVGIWRECIPEEVLEMIEEMKTDGVFEEMKADAGKDMLRANHWATIGIGCTDYYK